MSDYNSETMHNYGYFRVASCVPRVNVADTKFNVDNIVDMAQLASEKSVDLAVFPELSITGYTCGDLFHNSRLLDGACDALHELCDRTKELNTAFVVGVPLTFNNEVYNCAVFIYKGKIEGIVPKTYLPNHKEFYEKRWFSSGEVLSDNLSNNKLFKMGHAKIAIEICEDLWVPLAPSTIAALNGANIILNLSAKFILM